MMRGRGVTAVLAAMFLVCCCHSGGGDKSVRTGAGDPLVSGAVRHFPEVKVPSIYSEQDEVLDYVTSHFWDAFFGASGEWLCDSTHIAGVEEREFATELASYLSILENNCSLDNAQKCLSAFFDSLSGYQRVDTSSNAFAKITEAVKYYLYDPNSDIRSEDMYLPFVRKMAASDLVDDSLKPSYEFDVKMCSLNRAGTPAADFTFIDKSGRSRRMHDVKAEYTVMVFVNPGCKACGEAVETFTAPYMEQFISDGKIAVMDIYIDEDIDKWQENAADLPASWISGYDPAFIIRKDQIYNVRAIPSIYLLDKDKNVILKDATARRVVDYLTANIQ